jgi:hypothetical protein
MMITIVSVLTITTSPYSISSSHTFLDGLAWPQGMTEVEAALVGVVVMAQACDR